MAASPPRSPRARSVLEAAQEAPVWARLSERIQASEARLQAIRPLLPTAMRALVQPGPLEAGQWCILVSSSAAAAKLRQLLPSLRLHLDAQGLPVGQIRLKVSQGMAVPVGRR